MDRYTPELRPLPRRNSTPWSPCAPLGKPSSTAAVALSAQTKATSHAEEIGRDLEQFISHFLQVFNLAVARGLFPASARAFYRLDVKSAQVPSVTSHADRLTWAGNIIDGEADRAADEGPGTPATFDSGLTMDSGVRMDSNVGGYVPMAMPSAQDVANVLNAYTPAHHTASQKKDAYDLAKKPCKPCAPPWTRRLWINGTPSNTSSAKTNPPVSAAKPANGASSMPPAPANRKILLTPPHSARRITGPAPFVRRTPSAATKAIKLLPLTNQKQKSDAHQNPPTPSACL